MRRCGYLQAVDWEVLMLFGGIWLIDILLWIGVALLGWYLWTTVKDYSPSLIFVSLAVAVVLVVIVFFGVLL